MSRGRFTTLLVLLGVAVAAGSFALALTLLSDDGPDELDTSADDAGDDAPASTAASSTTAAPGPLDTPALVVIVSSEREQSQAQAVADRVGASGRSAGVLRSDDHSSLSPGFWVAYVGPFGDAAEADAEVAALAEDGFGGAYARCVGSEEECG